MMSTDIGNGKEGADFIIGAGVHKWVLCYCLQLLEVRILVWVPQITGTLRHRLLGILEDAAFFKYKNVEKKNCQLA